MDEIYVDVTGRSTVTMPTGSRESWSPSSGQSPLILSSCRDRSLARMPSPRLRLCAAIPAHNEEKHLEACLRAFTFQTDGQGRRLDPTIFEVILLLNNGSDGSAEVAHRFRARHPGLALHIVEVTFDRRHAHVGWARRLAMDEALARFHRLGFPGGVIATTDADSVVASDWVAQTLTEVAAGADAVGGRLMLTRQAGLDLDPRLRRVAGLHRHYERLVDRLTCLTRPDPFDPWPRHGDHGGASLAVTARAYQRAGGLPPLPTGEDQAFHAALRRTGARFRHSPRVRVVTSARLDGRTPGGMATTLAGWQVAGSAQAILVACPDRIVHRLNGGPQAIDFVAEAAVDRVPLSEALAVLTARVTTLEAGPGHHSPIRHRPISAVTAQQGQTMIGTRPVGQNREAVKVRHRIMDVVPGQGTEGVSDSVNQQKVAGRGEQPSDQASSPVQVRR